MYNKHHYYDTPEETVAGVLAAGTNVDCTSFVGHHAQSALDKKLITEDIIDTQVSLEYLILFFFYLQHSRLLFIRQEDVHDELKIYTYILNRTQLADKYHMCQELFKNCQKTVDRYNFKYVVQGFVEMHCRKF